MSIELSEEEKKRIEDARAKIPKVLEFLSMPKDETLPRKKCTVSYDDDDIAVCMAFDAGLITKEQAYYAGDYGRF